MYNYYNDSIEHYVMLSVIQVFSILFQICCRADSMNGVGVGVAPVRGAEDLVRIAVVLVGDGIALAGDGVVLVGDGVVLAGDGVVLVGDGVVFAGGGVVLVGDGVVFVGGVVVLVGNSVALVGDGILLVEGGTSTFKIPNTFGSGAGVFLGGVAVVLGFFEGSTVVRVGIMVLFCIRVVLGVCEGSTDAFVGGVMVLFCIGMVLGVCEGSTVDFVGGVMVPLGVTVAGIVFKMSLIHRVVLG